MQHEKNTLVLVLHLELHIPHSQSLKSKRKVIKALKDRLSNNFNAAVAEVGYLDKWQRAQLALAVAGGDHSRLEQQCQKMLSFVDQQTLGEAQVIAWDIETR